MMRRFKAETGYTIHGYLTEKRLLLARERIRAGEALGQVSEACGFQDYSTFSRAYKRGLEPALTLRSPRPGAWCLQNPWFEPYGEKNEIRPSRETLRCVAAGTMFIDHIGVALFPGVLWLRCVGRLAFPIFAFFLAGGVSPDPQPEAVSPAPGSLCPLG